MLTVPRHRCLLRTDVYRTLIDNRVGDAINSFNWCSNSSCFHRFRCTVNTIDLIHVQAHNYRMGKVEHYHHFGILLILTTVWGKLYQKGSMWDPGDMCLRHITIVRGIAMLINVKAPFHYGMQIHNLWKNAFSGARLSNLRFEKSKWGCAHFGSSINCRRRQCCEKLVRHILGFMLQWRTSVLLKN